MRTAGWFIVWSVCAAWAGGEESIPLYEQEPHDVIRLRDPKKPPQQVLPLDLPGRKMPDRPAPGDWLTIRFLDDALEEYRIQWRSIEGIEFYERRVLAEAESLIDAGRCDEAWDYFDFLFRRYPKLDTLAAAWGRYLEVDARRHLDAGRADHALAILNDLFTLDPKRAGLADLLTRAVSQLAEGHLARGDPPLARVLIDGLGSKFPQRPEVASWRQRLQTLAREQIEAGTASLERGEVGETHRLARQAALLAPELDEVRQFATRVYRELPRAVVAVRSSPWSGGRMTPARRLIDGSARRDVRLADAGLSTWIGPGNDGGLYQFNGVEVSAELGDPTVLISLTGSGESAGTAPLVRQFMHLADPRSPLGDPLWQRLLASVEQTRFNQLALTWRQPPLLPAALLSRLPVTIDRASAAGPSGLMAPYQPILAESSAVVWGANGAGSPREVIVERFEGLEAERALREREVVAIDRLAPWEVAAWRGASGFVVEPYAAPTIHVLLPRRDRPLLGLRTFRRALLYGIERGVILNQLLLRGEKLPGSELLSGPCPRALAPWEALGYASKETLQPRPYDPELALALIGVAQRELAAAKRVDPLDEEHPLVLEHAPWEPDRLACEAIREHLARIGVPVRLVVASGDQLASRADLRYAALSVTEPLLDVFTLFGAGGLVAGNVWIDQELERLSTAADWKEARGRLQQLHQWVYDDVSLLPLWQLPEYLVYHRSLAGVGARPATLFQNVEQWRLSPPWWEVKR